MTLLIKVWGVHNNTGLGKIKFRLNLDAKTYLFTDQYFQQDLESSITIMLHKVYGWEKKWRNNLKTCCGGCAETEGEERI